MAGWRDLVRQSLERRFPETAFTFINAGIPSLGSVPDAFRLERDVLSGGPVDLLFVDAAVNDTTNGTTTTEQLRAIEGIVRHVRRINPAADVVFLYFAEPGMMRAIRAGERPAAIVVQERIADHYGLPSVDLLRDVVQRIDAHEFGWEKEFGGLHPAPFGHAVYARAIDRLLDAAWQSVGAPIQARRALPAPLDPGNYAHGRIVSPKQAHTGEGWEYLESWHPRDRAATRPGYVDVPAVVSATPGAALRFDFRGSAIGLLAASGPDAGGLEWRMDGGPFVSRDLYTRWSPSLHLPWAVMMADNLPLGLHHITLRVAGGRDSPNPRSAVRILEFFVDE